MQQPGMVMVQQPGMVMVQQPQQQVQMAPVNNYVVQQQVVTQQVIQQVVVQAPAANNTWEYDQAPSIKYGGESFMIDPPNCSQYCYMYWCPCKAWATFTAKGNKSLVYYNNCTIGPPCCQDYWRAKYVDATPGNKSVTKIGYTTGMTAGQGACKFLCPCGDAILQNFHNQQGKRIYTIRKKITCVNCCCARFTGVGIACMYLCDACAWCSNKQYVVLNEKIANADGKEQVGEINQLLRIDCIQGMAVRTPIRYSVKMYHNSHGVHDAVLVGLLPLFYMGMPVPCQCCVAAPASPLTGVDCIDSGRAYTMTRGNLKSVLNTIGQPSVIEMER